MWPILVAVALLAFLWLGFVGFCVHEDELRIDDLRLYVRCVKCGRETPGIVPTDR